jgi:hypothetical protein
MPNKTATFALASLLAVSLFACRRSPSENRGENRPTEAPRAATSEPAPPQVTVSKWHRVGESRSSAALLLARSEGRSLALVVDPDDEALVELDATSGATVGKTRLGAAPREALVLADGRLAVTLPSAHAVALLERASGAMHFRESARIPTPDDPQSLALSPDLRTLYVSTGASHTLVAYEVADGREKGRTTLGRDPRGITTSRDGKKVYVALATEDGVAVVEGLDEGRPVAKRIAETTGSSKVARHTRHLVPVASGGKDLFLASGVTARPNPGAGGITSIDFEPMMKPMPKMAMNVDVQFQGEMPMPMFGGDGATGYGTSAFSGPPERFSLRAIAEENGKTTVAVEEGECLLPSDTVTSGPRVFVGCEGSRSLLTFEVRDRANDPFVGVGKDANEGRPTALGSPRTVKLSEPADALAMGPDGHTLYTFSRESRTLLAFAIDTKAKKLDASTEQGRLFSVTLSRDLPREASWLAGRALFHRTFDPRISSDGRACASCHVDGADDAIVWTTPEGKRRTRTLAGQLGSGPFGWKGEHATLEKHVQVTFKQLGGKGLPEAELASLVVYLKDLGAPKRVRPELGPEAKHGAELFASTKYDCASCHSGGGSDTDRVVHDVGSGGPFMTPTLSGVGTRPKLFHDGRYSSLDELLTKSKSMGRASEMSEDERRAMQAYLATL